MQGRPIARQGWAIAPGLQFFGAQNIIFLIFKTLNNGYIFVKRKQFQSFQRASVARLIRLIFVE